MDIFKNSFRKRQEKIYKENGYIQVNDLFPKYKLRNLRVSLIKTLNNSINKNLLINKTDSDEVLVNQIEILQMILISCQNLLLVFFKEILRYISSLWIKKF